MYNERSPHKTWTKSYWRMGSLDSGPSLLISLLWVCYPIRNHFVIYKVSVGQATFWSTWILKCVRWNWSHLKMHTEIFRKLCRISTFEKPLHLKYPPSYSTPKNQKKQMLFWHRLIVLSSFFFFLWSCKGTFLLLQQLCCRIQVRIEWFQYLSDHQPQASECYAFFLSTEIEFPPL